MDFDRDEGMKHGCINCFDMSDDSKLELLASHCYCFNHQEVRECATNHLNL